MKMNPYPPRSTRPRTPLPPIPLAKMSSNVSEFIKLHHPELYKNAQEKIEGLISFPKIPQISRTPQPPPSPPTPKIPEIPNKSAPLHVQHQELLIAWATGKLVDEDTLNQVVKMVKDIQDAANMFGYDRYEECDHRQTAPIFRDNFSVVHFLHDE